MLLEAAQNLFGPSSIFFPLYVVSAVVLTVAWLAIRHDLAPANSLRKIFDRETWTSKSSRTDLALTIFHLVLWRGLLSTVEAAAFAAALSAPAAAGTFLRIHSSLELSPWFEGLLATLITMIGFDFASYLVHRAMHLSPTLWSIHALHHSAEVLTPLTTYRQHPLEPLVLNVARMTGAGIALGILHLILPRQTPVVTVFGLGAGFFVYMFTVNLHHWTVPVDYPRWLKHILISPRMHHIHHSIDSKHHGRNFGVVFSIWDRVLGTCLDEDVALGQLRFGLAGDNASDTR